MELVGLRSWSASVDKYGYTLYKAIFRVSGTALDGPYNAMNCPGLPVAGDTWNIALDTDLWATCRQDRSATPVLKDETNLDWDVEVTFSSNPDDGRCMLDSIKDPLLTPPVVSGAFNKYQEEAVQDRFGDDITNSAFEPYKGPQVEFDKNRPTIKVQMNVASILTVALAHSMIDTVNDSVLWGFWPRSVKLSACPWERKYYHTCNVYYSLTLEFDQNDASFDRDLLDEGTKVLNGHYAPSGAWVLDNIGGLQTPAKPTLSVAALVGGIPAGTYGYRVSVRNALGETLAGPEATVTFAAASSVTVTVPAVLGATSYELYGRTPGAELHMLFSFSPSILDNGSLTPSGALPAADTTGGVPPDPTNPTHFIKYKDKNGAACRVVLNGNGVPATTVKGFAYYVSLVNTNLGNALTDPASWIRSTDFSSVDGGVKEWDKDIAYTPGMLAVQHGTVWVATAATIGRSPDVTPSAWEDLEVADVTGKGSYSSTVSYSKGDVVLPIQSAGRRHVEKYDESNFYLLGIPVVL